MFSIWMKVRLWFADLLPFFEPSSKLDRILSVFSKTRDELEEFVQECFEQETQLESTIRAAKKEQDATMKERRRAGMAMTKLDDLLGNG